MKYPQTPRRPVESFLQKMMSREKDLAGSVAELLAKNLKLEAENERLRNALLSQAVGSTNAASTADSKQPQ